LQHEDIIQGLQKGDLKSIARAITLVENESQGWWELLSALPHHNTVPVIGFTGPPGAGKSTLINAFIDYIISSGEQNKRIAVIAVDPTSPFTKGSLLGDRIRMSQHFLHPNVYIRSMATRGSLGGLSPKVFEVVDVLKSSHFDYIIVETVGVGQSEVEIAGLADTTVLVLVPEAGDEVQGIKSGVMEIADVFVVNKADRDGAASFYKNICMVAIANSSHKWQIPVIKTIATDGNGIEELYLSIIAHQHTEHNNEKRSKVLAEKAMQLIRKKRTVDIDFQKLAEDIQNASSKKDFNLYLFLADKF